MLWTLRPWAFWAVLNLFYRGSPSAQFNEPRTFPFYGHLWNPEFGWREQFMWLIGRRAVWTWGLASLTLTAALVLGTVHVLRQPLRTRRGIAIALTSGCLLTAVLHLTVGAMPTGLTAPDDARPFPSLLLPWHRAGNTMLYAMRHIRGTTHFLDHFSEIHPHLRHYIHPFTHPPGASLALYWIGKTMGLTRAANIRLNAVKFRYAVGLTFFSALGYAAAFFLGLGLGSSPRVGWLSAALWATAPLTLYNTFAMNGLFSVFFVFGLVGIWRVGTAERIPWAAEVALGLCFFVLNWLCFSWTILTTIFAVFIAWRWREARWTWREATARFVPPLAVMTVLSTVVLLRYSIRYLAIYRAAHAYACEWYDYKNGLQSLLALIGGQLDLFLLAGAIVLPAAIAAIRRPALPRDARAFAVIVAAIFALPLLFGPGCLRMETARCWNWVAVAAIALAARELWERFQDANIAALAIAISALVRHGLRLFVDII